MQYSITILWLAAIVAANLSIGHFGPSASVVNAFLLIGLTLTTRDVLHKHWEGKNLKLKMGSLIAAGGILSWITQPSVGGIAIASVTAFAVSEVIDSIIYSKTKSINKSNVVSAGVDSIIFPVMAFGGFPILIILGQWVAKVFGGALWKVIIESKSVRKVGVFALALCGVSASAESLDVFSNEHGEYVTFSHFSPGLVETFAFVDLYQYDPEVIYGEFCAYYNEFDIAPTVQAEFGDSELFEIEEVLLAGFRYNGVEVLFRSDDTVQLTYVWFYRYKDIQFNGYIDAWDFNDLRVTTQPQLWYWINDSIAIGGEAFISYYDNETECTPAIGLKINF
jgi:hypothetical protein